jgi:hypothetical protein
VFALTSQGHPYARFRRALASGNPTLAYAAAAELPYLAIEDALALTLLLASREPPRYGRVALRWHARYCRELPGVELDKAVAVLALLSALRGQAAGAAASVLAELLSGRNEPRLAEVVRRWQVERHRTTDVQSPTSSAPPGQAQPSACHLPQNAGLPKKLFERVTILLPIAPSCRRVAMAHTEAPAG